MKNIFVVGKENIALKMNDEKKAFVMEGADTVEALLLVVKDSLEKVPLNDDMSQEPVMIFLPGYIKGIASGNVINYFRNKKTGAGDADGKEISESNLALYKEVMEMYGARCLNVAFRDAQYISEKEKSLKDMNNLAWDAVKKHAKERALKGVAPAAPTAPAVNPKIAAKIAELEEQIMDAILSDDEELETSLTVKLNKIKAMAGIGTSVPKAAASTEEKPKSEKKSEKALKASEEKFEFEEEEDFDAMEAQA